jgi:hypothetical protein
VSERHVHDVECHLLKQQLDRSRVCVFAFDALVTLAGPLEVEDGCLGLGVRGVGEEGHELGPLPQNLERLVMWLEFKRQRRRDAVQRENLSRL